ncbi:MAG: PqqD family protein [Gammaproteobacteria bacterium]|nr:PqqD family protein [Gammaproteobacteria bacterium]
MPRLYTVPREVVGETLEGRAVVLHLHTGRYFALNSTGTRMWQLLAAHGDPLVAIDEIAALHGVDRAIVERDLFEFVSELIARGLLIAPE